MRVQPYLYFEGHCEEAIEFYRKVFGAEVTMLMRYKENPEPLQPDMVPPGSENKVMHSSFTIGETTVMASDGRCSGKTMQTVKVLVASKTALADRYLAGMEAGWRQSLARLDANLR